ncbi:MAG: NAD-dependent epimerase/dehydratase family protein [Candidatus Sumerlaeota bacterium]|nr:NAD-dependent epimerase/dehydratase family protein [Candidatus Sumerlaeota bacterium]
MAHLTGHFPDEITTEAELEDLLSAPESATVDLFRRIEGDVMILGAGGKMGPTLARMARRAALQAGKGQDVIAVSRFSESSGARETLEQAGVRTIACDLGDIDAVRPLPAARNIIYMAGRKFGERGSEPLTWLMNAVVPANVAQTFRDSRIVVYSTGCVYPLVAPQSGGCSESVPPAPAGEYAASCLGRERIFQYYSSLHGAPALILRLNYAVELRYGVLADIARTVAAGAPIDLTVSSVNVIWQGDANNRALRCLELASSPPAALNITGLETLSIYDLAVGFGRLMGKVVTFRGQPGAACYLSDSRRSMELFGAPRVSVTQIMPWIAKWIASGGRNLDKPTHFSVTDGQFLD